MKSKVISSAFYGVMSAIMFALFVVQVSDLFRLPLLVGVSLSIVAGVTLVITTVYLLLHLPIVKFLFRKLVVQLLFAIKVVVPVVLGVLHSLQGFLNLSGFIRPFLLNVMFFNLFLCAVIVCYKWNLSKIKWLLASIVVIVLAGLGANYAYPEFFYGIKLAVWGVEKDLSNLDLDDIQRTAGFYLKSTSASASMLLLYPATVIVFGKKIMPLAVSYLLLLVAVFLTGARSGIAITLMLSPIILISIMRFVNYKFQMRPQGSVNFGLLLIPLFVGLFGLIGSFAIASAESFNLTSLSERLATLTTVSSIKNDDSLNQRSEAQGKYLNFIAQQPLTGFGPTHSKTLKERGELWLSSHNTYIEGSFQYGILFFLLFLMLVGVLLYGVPAHVFTRYTYIDYFTLLGFILLAYSFFASTIMSNRSLFFSLGVMLGLSLRSRAISQRAELPAA